jgi:formate-dependent nitrite reductase cytochrome c552 subunit
MADPRKQPVIVLLTCHWITMAGVALVTLAGFSWLFALPANIQGHAANPYIGLLVFIAIPVVFFAGLALIPVGIALGRRRAASTLGEAADRKAAWRRAGIFFAIMTMANLVIGSQLTYRAVEHMETVQFCGQSCHVMKPEFTAHLLAPHSAVACVECHVAPGASGWVQSKINGSRQLRDVVLNTYSRPIESAMESNRLVSSADTCEQCHAREKFIGPRLRIHSEFKDDETNTRMETVLMMKVGGGSLGGIHGAHMGPGVRIRYAAADKKRQTIPWVEYNNSSTNVTRSYLAGGTKAEAVGSLPVFEMQCVDCHNRAAHSFDLPEHAVDRAMARGEIPVDLPFIKKTSLESLKQVYAGQDDAAQKIPAALSAFYQQKYGDVWAKRSNDIRRAGQALVEIYGSNVFPDLKVTWGTYPNNLGHMDDPGCFRCHDDSHANLDAKAVNKKTIPQDCDTCHELLATGEPSPAIMKTLGLGK